MVQGDDDGPRAEEEEALEEGVGEKVEHGRVAGRTHADTDNHVAELGDGRISKDALDVVLLDGHQTRGKAGDGADPHDDIAHDVWSGKQNRENASQHVDAGGDHGGGVEERGHRGRAFHRVGQPDVERHLGGLANGAAEDEEAGGDKVAGMEGDSVEVCFDPGEHDRAGGQPEHEDAEHEAEITDAVDGESLFGGVRRGVLAEIVPDEQVGAGADQFPEDEHHDKVVGQDNAEHGKEEQAERCVVARDTFITAHVAGGINEDEGGDGRDNDEHDPAEVVEDDADGNGEDAGDFDPGDLRGYGKGRIEENFPTEKTGQRDGEDTDRTGGDIAARENEEDERGRGERGEEDDPGIKLRGHLVRISSG